MTPDEVLRLPNEEMLVIIRGHNVLKLEKLDYTELPMAKEIQRISIMDYCPAPIPMRSPETPSQPETPPITQPKRKHRSLYSSAQPPEGF